MLRKIIVITFVAAMAALTFAEPGTWGNEPKTEKVAKAPAAQFGRWLKDFRGAYEQRDGEKMCELLKAIEGKDLPDMPRLEKWLNNVKETYEAQDVQKMARLLDNAEQVRDRIRERIRENRDEMQGRGGEAFGQDDQRGERFAGPRRQSGDDFADRDFGPMNRFQERRQQRAEFNSDDEDNRPGEFREHRGVPMGGEFEGPRVMRRFEQRRQMQPEAEQGIVAPRFGQRDRAGRDGLDVQPYGRADMPEFAPRFEHRRMNQQNQDERPMMRGEFGQRGFAPQRPDFDQMPQRPSAPRMRGQFRRQFDKQDVREDEQTQEHDTPNDFWR